MFNVDPARECINGFSFCCIWHTFPRKFENHFENGNDELFHCISLTSLDICGLWEMHIFYFSQCLCWAVFERYINILLLIRIYSCFECCMQCNSHNKRKMNSVKWLGVCVTIINVFEMWMMVIFSDVCNLLLNGFCLLCLLLLLFINCSVYYLITYKAHTSRYSTFWLGTIH